MSCVTLTKSEDLVSLPHVSLRITVKLADLLGIIHQVELVLEIEEEVDYG